MVYANGKGVTRNIDLAIRFACEADSLGPAEDRIKHLEALKSQEQAISDFDVCDDISQNPHDFGIDVNGGCLQLNDKSRAQALDNLISKWRLRDRQAFAKLKKVAEEFFDQRIAGEVDQSGTGRYEMAYLEGADLRREFLTALQKFENGNVPKFTIADRAAATSELNAVYKGVTETLARFEGPLTAEGVKHTQEAWLSYVEAWVIFGRQKYPKVTPESWRVWLIRERIGQLRQSFP